MKHILWDLNGCLVHNNKSLGTGDLPEGTDTTEAAADGTLPRGYYLTTVDDIVWMDGALEAIGILTNNNHPQHVITNQEHIGLGIITMDDWTRLVEYMDGEIAEAGGSINNWYFCPHAPDVECECRKRSSAPGLHMFYQCALDYNFQLYNSYMVGDNISDMVAGKLCGCHTIMTPSTTKYDQELIDMYVDTIVSSPMEAAKYIVGNDNVE